MRGTCTILGMFLLCACASAPQLNNAEFAEIDVATAPECKEASAIVRELRNPEGRDVRTKALPARIKPGVYAVGVSCGTIFDGKATACIDTSLTESRTDVAPYELLLRTQRRYVFSCSLVRGQNVIRLSDTAL